MAILIVVVLVALIAFYQVFMQGLFSALITTGLSVVAALTAFNYFEVLAGQLDRAGLAAYGSESLSLVALFLVVLLVLRLVTDRLIPANMQFPVLIDRIGATVFGLVSGLVIVGVLVTGVAMLPLGPTLLGFDRYPDKDPQAGKVLFPNPDGFVQGMVARASRYGFAGGAQFVHYHPNMQRELYMQRQTLVEGSRREAARGSVQVTSAWLPEGSVRAYGSGESVGASGGERLVAVRLALKPGRDEEPGAADPDGKIRMTLAQVRLVGFDPEDKTAGTVRYPLGILKPGWQLVERPGLGGGKMFADARPEVDLLFSWPEPLEKRPPLYVEFKGSARGTLGSAKKLSEAGPPVDARYGAARLARTAPLEAPQRGGGGLKLKSLTMEGPGRAPVDDRLMSLGLPLQEWIEKARRGEVDVRNAEEGMVAYKELSPIVERAGRWSGGHLLMSLGQQFMGSPERGARPGLFVPPGYSLAWVELEGGPNAKAESRLSSLVSVEDVYGRQYPAVGYSLTLSGTGGMWSEVAYMSDTEAIGREGFEGYPAELAAPAGMQMRSAVMFYLIPQDEARVGLVGVRVRERPRDAGAMWTLSDGVDVVLASEGE